MKRNELLINETTWMNLRIIMQNEVCADGVTWNLSSCTRGIGGLTMAKDKLRGQKSRSVFPTASQKSFKVKNKAKPVTTNLKINIVNDEKDN